MKPTIENTEENNLKKSVQNRLHHAQRKGNKSRRKTLLIDTHPKKEETIEEKKTEVDEIKEIKEEIDNLQTEIKLSRENALKC